MDEPNGLFVRGLAIRWEDVPPDSYLRGIPALQLCAPLALHRPVTFLVGENGTGKSTLLEALAVCCGLNPEGGSQNYRFSSYDSHSELGRALRLVRGPYRPQGSYFLRAESFYNVASQTEVYRQSGLGDEPVQAYYRRFGGRSFHEQSHGESFLALVQGEFIGGGLYLLDEPEAALSPQRQLTLLIELDRLAREGAQFIIASHSPVLLALPGAEILSFDEGPIHPCAYTQTESYRITSLFINRREWFLKQLLEEDPHVF